MQAFPHHYTATVDAKVTGNLKISSHDLPVIESAPPVQFDGPGGLWSPEDLFVASVADCFVLSFKAVARASKIEWVSISCESIGELDRVDGKTLFTKIITKVKLIIPERDSIEKAEKILHKAEAVCLITNSLTAEVELICSVSNN